MEIPVVLSTISYYFICALQIPAAQGLARYATVSVNGWLSLVLIYRSSAGQRTNKTHRTDPKAGFLDQGNVSKLLKLRAKNLDVPDITTRLFDGKLYAPTDVEVVRAAIRHLDVGTIASHSRQVQCMI